MIALIPARGGSVRLPGKNMRLLGGHPLLAYAIASARASGVFGRIVVSSDSKFTLACAEAYGAEPLLRDPQEATAESADIAWVRSALKAYPRRMAFAILRPTAPFRTAETIRRAYAQFDAAGFTADSLRAVEPVNQHPGKMWEWAGPGSPITPLLTGVRADGVPWHSCPTQTLPTVYVQNASLEMAFTSNVEVYGTIHGRKVAPFFTDWEEGFDINTARDWRDAEWLVAEGLVTLPDPSPVAASAAI